MTVLGRSLHVASRPKADINGLYKGRALLRVPVSGGERFDAIVRTSTHAFHHDQLVESEQASENVPLLLLLFPD